MSDKKEEKKVGAINTWNPKIWGRNYKLTILPKDQNKIITFEPPMQIVFNVTGAAGDGFKVADIAVYGVSKATREKIYNEYDTVILEAGYGDKMAQIFLGQINNYETGKDGVNTYIKFYCFSQLQGINNSMINKTWGEKTPVIDMISDVAKTLSNNVEIIGDFSQIPPLLLGGTRSQNSIEAMRELSSIYSFYWALEDTKVKICRKNSAGKDRHEISVRTGMEGIPRVYHAAIEVDMRINPSLKVFDLIDVYSNYEQYGFSEMYKVPSKLINDLSKAQGVYQILSIAHKGDYYHDSWTTTVSAYIMKGGS